jgi:sugar phosphate isomerase/epimerase
MRAEVERCARLGFAGYGVLRAKAGALGTAAARAALASAGLTPTALNIAGFFTLPDRDRRVEDARRAVADAAELGAPALTIVSGPGDVALLRDGLERVLPDAAAAGVALAVEPLHPMYAEASALFTLDAALDVVEAIGSPWLRVTVDLYHLWWDRGLPAALRRAAGRVAAVHVADWRLPTRSLNDRARAGHGAIPLARLLAMVLDAGYAGMLESEVLSDELAALDPETVMAWHHDDLAAVATSASASRTSASTDRPRSSDSS